MIKPAIILVYPRISFEDNYPCTWLPYSLLALASALSPEAYKVIIFDENREDEIEFESLLKNHQNILCIGFSIMTGGGQIANALKLASMAKKIYPSVTTVFGGPHVNVLPEQTLEHYLVDFVLSGPGQIPFSQFCKALADQKTEVLRQIPGVGFQEDGFPFWGPVNLLTQDSIVPYHFENIDIAHYIQSDTTIGTRIINYIASQGCVYRCRFCYETNYNRKYVKLPIENIVQDLRFFKRTYGINGIKFYDADWFIYSELCDKLIDFLITEQLNWAASIHPKDILSAIRNKRPLLSKLAQSKCKRLLMGIESGCNRVLKEIVNKLVTKEEIFQVAKAIAEHGIMGSYTFIVGFPNETQKEQNETFEFIQQLRELSPCPETRVHIYTPYPGTPLYLTALELGFRPPQSLEEWSKFDYYKIQTPWTDVSLEKKVKEFTHMTAK